MTGMGDRLAQGARRGQTWLKNARVTAEVAAAALNPLAGPVAQQADLIGPKPKVEISQELIRKEQHEWEQVELEQCQREDASLPTHTGQVASAGRDQSRNNRDARRTRER